MHGPEFAFIAGVSAPELHIEAGDLVQFVPGVSYPLAIFPGSVDRRIITDLRHLCQSARWRRCQLRGACGVRPCWLPQLRRVK